MSKTDKAARSSVVTKLRYVFKFDSNTENKVINFSRAFRQVLLDREIGPLRFNELLGIYIQKYFVETGRIKNTHKSISDKKQAIIRQFSSSNMSFEVFQKAMIFLQVEELKIEIRINN